MEEIWKDILGYENKYQVSNYGNVRSLNFNNTGKIKLLKKKINRFGFSEVGLSKNNIKKDFMVSRLVAEAFIPNPLFKDVVMHISADKQDDSVLNLRWAYYSERQHNTYNKGCRKGRATHTLITYKNKNYTKYKDIAKDLGINQRTFYKRIYELGWNLYEALEVPTGKE